MTLTDELYMIYARDHPNETPAVIRRWAEREAQYQRDEREAIQQEPSAV